MGQVILHSEFRAGVTMGPQGDVHISYRDGETIHVFPMGRDESMQHAEQIKRKASGIVLPQEGA